MTTTFHLDLAAPPGDSSAGEFVATLRRADTGASATRKLAIPEHLQKLAKQLANGALGADVAAAVKSAGPDLAQLLAPKPAVDGAFQGLANLLLTTGGSRLVVHVPKDLEAHERKLLEHLPWTALDGATRGHLTVVHSVADPGVSLHTFRNRIATRADAAQRLRVLVVIGCIEQAWFKDSNADFARASIEALRAGLEASIGKDPKHPRIDLRIVAPSLQLTALNVPGLGATQLASIDELRQILRGERSVNGIKGFDIVHFVGHSDATSTEPATRLLCGFQPIATTLREHPAADCLTAAQLAADLAAPAVAERTVLCVFENCAIGSSFLSPVLRAIDHAIGTQGLISPKLGRQWTSTFYQHIANFTPVGEALREARRTIRESEQPVLEDSWWQLTHWTACDTDHPFGTADGFALREYARHMRTSLQNLEGEFDKHSLHGIAIPLAIEHVADGKTPQEQDEREQPERWRQRGERGEITLHALVTDSLGGAFFLLGEPGGGKTVSERHTAHELLQALKLDSLDEADLAAADTDTRRIPVYVRLPEWVRSDGRAPSLENVIAFSLAKLPNLDERGRRRIVELLIKHRSRLVVLLDGWDEIPGKRDERDPDYLSPAKDLVTALVDAAHAPHALVVACRFAARPEPFAKVTELRVLRLDRGRQEDLLERWFRPGPDATPESRARAHTIVDTLQRQPGSLRQLVSIPLYLGLLGRVVAGHPDIALPKLLGTIQRRHTFFDSVVRVLLTNRHRAARTNNEDWLRRQLRVLRSLAFSLVCQGRLELTKAELDDELLDLDADHCSALREDFHRSGLLRPVDRALPDGAWGLQHRSLLEALVAQHLAAEDEPKKRRDDLRKKRRLEAESAIAQKKAGRGNKGAEDPAKFWVEPFALVAGYLKADAPAWIQWLLAQPQLRSIGLAAVALADTEHIPATLVRKVLEKNQDLDWQQRRPVYESLLPPFGRGASADVRNQLLRYVHRERTSDGQWRINRNELWFVDQVFAQVVEDTTLPANVRKQACEQRDELMGLVGVPKLPEDLVAILRDLPTSVEAGKDSSSYWRFVPKGYAMIGSPLAEQGHRSDEPLTPIAVRQPFWMAEVHVTAKLWALFTGRGFSCSAQEARRSEPARNVAWYECTMFSRWLSVHLRQDLGAEFEVRLPSEWQWEYAARFHSVVPASALPQWASPPFGWVIQKGTPVAVTHDNLDRLRGEKRDEPGPCGDKRRQSNRLGLRDLMRFLWTWCSNAHGPYRGSQSPLESPVAEEQRSEAPRALRGGSFRSGAVICRAANRFRFDPDVDGGSSGLRLVCVRVSPQLD